MINKIAGHNKPRIPILSGQDAGITGNNPDTYDSTRKVALGWLNAKFGVLCSKKPIFCLQAFIHVDSGQNIAKTLTFQGSTADFPLAPFDCSGALRAKADSTEIRNDPTT